MLRQTLGAAGLLVTAAVARPAQAITVEIDTTGGTFFSGNAAALAAVQAAANDVSAAITSALGATTDTSTGSASGTNVTFNFRYTYKNPYSSSNTVTVNDAALPANTFKVYTGVQTLTGSTLGQGGPGGFGYSASANSSANLPAAVDAAEAAGNTNMTRGAVPVMGQLSGQFQDQSSNPIPNTQFTLNFGPTIGNLWFDSDTNWHFNHTTPVAGGTFDLYSVALHEILHALGVGGSLSWNNLATGNDWAGSNVISLLGTGQDVLETPLSGDGAHIAPGLTSRNIYTLALQEAAMDPDITSGTRKQLTELDLAFLKDIGWSTVAVPEPTTALLLAGSLAALLRRRAA